MSFELIGAIIHADATTLASPLSSVCDGDHRMSDLTGALAHKLVRGSQIFPLMSAWGQIENWRRGS
jgi:hypothetical protein